MLFLSTSCSKQISLPGQDAAAQMVQGHGAAGVDDVWGVAVIVQDMLTRCIPQGPAPP